MTDEKITIDLTKPETFLGHEFYLMIAAKGFFEAQAKLAEEEMNPIKKLVYKLIGKERKRDLKPITGSLYEISNRQPHSITGYLWPEFDEATLEDGTRAATIVPIEKIYSEYLFVPNAIHVEGAGYRISGTMKKFELYNNRVVDDLEQKVNIFYDNPPKYKYSGGEIMCM